MEAAPVSEGSEQRPPPHQWWHYTWRASRPGKLFAAIAMLIFLVHILPSSEDQFSLYGECLFLVVTLCNHLEERSVQTNALVIMAGLVGYITQLAAVGIRSSFEGWVLVVQFVLFAWTCAACLLRTHPAAVRGHSTIYGQVHRFCYEATACSNYDENGGGGEPVVV
jgi:hypothetical protein